jgi:hypothetical protein
MKMPEFVKKEKVMIIGIDVCHSGKNQWLVFVLLQINLKLWTTSTS